MSIVDNDYRDRYRGRGDWLKQLIDKNCYSPITKVVEELQPDGTTLKVEKETKRKKLDPDAMFNIALENGIDEDRLTKFRGALGTHGSEGRARMSVGNMLRSVAKKNGGLSVNGTFIEAPAEFLPEEEEQQEAA